MELEKDQDKKEDKYAFKTILSIDSLSVTLLILLNLFTKNN